MSEAAIEGTAVEDTPPEPQVTEQHSTEVARRERRSEVIRPLDADQLIESFTAYQELLPRLLDASDYQPTGKDKDGNERKFVKKSGWRKIATAFDLDVLIIRSTVDRDEHGRPCRAEVWARAIAPSGRSMDGDGYCSVDEERFGKADDTAWKIAKARAKLENDLRGTATTRAMNRAISGLVGMGDVSAEEVSDGDQQQQALPWWAEPASDDRKKQALDAVETILGGDRDGARALLKTIADQLGLMPDLVPAAVKILAVSVESRRVSTDPEPGHEGETGQETLV